jgi:hypothetical protein
MNTLEKIDKYFIPFLKKHPIISTIVIVALIISVIILFIPLFILFIIGYTLHRCFYTGIVYKNVNGKPRQTWI